jgi:bifunctional DNA-binding transcriptional regulator/antitoxin component of YhaV-PrlF toxin-antitoxin module
VELPLTESRVGSKGEIFPPKAMREKLGLRPHVRVKYKIEDGRLVVEPIPTLHDVLNEPQAVETTLGELKKFRKEISKKAES